MKQKLKPGGHVAPHGTNWRDPEKVIPLDRLRIYTPEDIAELQKLPQRIGYIGSEVEVLYQSTRRRESEEQKQQRVDKVKDKAKQNARKFMATYFDDPAPAPTMEQLKQLIHYEPMPESVKAEMKRGALETATHALDAFSYALNKFIKPLKKATIMDRNFQPNEEKTAEQKWTLTNANMLKQAVTRMETLEHELQNAHALGDKYYREIVQLERVQSSNEKRIGQLEEQISSEINARHDLAARMGATVTAKNKLLEKMGFENEKLRATIKTMKKNRAR